MSKNQLIWKFALNNRSTEKPFILNLPKDAEILTVQIDQSNDGDCCIWVLFNEDNKDELQMRTFEIFGTGHLINNDIGVVRKYIGTFQEKRIWNYVWHLFERLN